MLTRGASMGRPSARLPETDRRVFVTLRRVRIDSGGYDSTGVYWGLGLPLYWAHTEDSETGFYFRAVTRDAAKRTVRETVPNARFAR